MVCRRLLLGGSGFAEKISLVPVMVASPGLNFAIQSGGLAGLAVFVADGRRALVGWWLRRRGLQTARVAWRRSRRIAWRRPDVTTDRVAAPTAITVWTTAAIITAQ